MEVETDCPMSQNHPTNIGGQFTNGYISPRTNGYSTGGNIHDNQNYRRENIGSGSVCHPSDGRLSNSQFSEISRTRGQNILTSNSVQQNSNSSPGYNFSFSNSDSSNRHNNVNGSYNYNERNMHNLDTGLLSMEAVVSNLDNLSINTSDSSFVFNRPQMHINNGNQRRRREMQLQNSKYPDYRTEAQRIQSFAMSVVQAKSPQEMSDAGFFAISNQDFVRCFHCGIGLRNWEEEDDPYVEHCRWSPNCQYMKIKKGQIFIDAVQEAVRKVQLEEALAQSETRDGTQTDSTHPYPDLVEDGLNGESYPMSVLKKNPLLSNAAQSVIEMGYLPRVVKRAVDSIIQSHGFQALTGARIANLVLDMEAKGEKVRTPIQQATNSTTCTENSKISTETKTKLEQQNREYKEKLLCVICCEAQRAITFLPCGHLVCCAQCAPACTVCAVCRMEIKGTIKVSLR